MQPKSVSLIVTTYNWPKALELVLRSIERQSMLPNEVIIADDGSTDDTRQLINQYQQHFPVPLIHSWQEDTGFRAARSRNLAIARAQSDYIVMIDGDMLLHRHFIRDHKRIAKPDYFIQGRRVILTPRLTEQLFHDHSLSLSLFSADIKNKMNAICSPLLSTLMSPLLSKKSYHSIRSCNLAAWRSNIITINGFNEDFVGWGREDSEFIVRLLNSGIKRQDLRFGGVAYHLFHHENTRSNLADNDKRLALAISNKECYCQHGIKQHLAYHTSEVKHA
ncbi:glycosyltransferase involved in cell wall biosynthesis [Orbus hercynius]|uniref:Glycosyltransferase involved in cell wall biosynthesis n=1 Tax=Orbus hercynius TaxID=593135 RepID=A0A495REP2_9GAMM|nr:glycosyltransferase [Orbus hercynius]RKS85953.1 glycosyltransferase involved in cell wall biosynthesis [Orbus hercynius]